MIEIYTDGACQGNPGPGGWGALIIRDDKYREIGGYSENTTNNIMEMMAAINALKFTEKFVEPITIYTDSKYVKNGITTWIHNWKRKGWRRSNGGEVKNLKLWKALDYYNSPRVTWKWVKGHSDNVYNNHVDRIARAFSRSEEIKLGKGKLLDLRQEKDIYGAEFEIFEGNESESFRDIDLPYPRKVYLSLINKDLQRHSSWVACKARVYGVPGARHKSCKSYSQELETIRSWGLPDEVLKKRIEK
ncbi:MAG: ribonuclease HI [Candidatus Eremiobacteraeota bacterium]|nr:ribonuclease HI [Candidatus Eremiobacteraeota bacterium]